MRLIAALFAQLAIIFFLCELALAALGPRQTMRMTAVDVYSGLPQPLPISVSMPGMAIGAACLWLLWLRDEDREFW